MKECGAKTRSGSPCRKAAMENGRCKLHGGMSTGAPIKHGRYSKFAPAKIREKMDSFDGNDPFSLLDELTTQRGLIAEYLSRFENTNLTAHDIDFMVGWLAEVGRTVERITKMRNETALTAAEVAYIAARIPDIVQRYIDDTDRQKAFVRELLSVTTRTD